MNIVVTAVSFCKNAELRQLATEAFTGHTVTFAAGEGPLLAGDALVASLAEADLAIVGRETINDAILVRIPRLKAISLYGVGFDNIDVEACRRRGVAFEVAHGVNALAVAEHTIGLMLAVLRNIARNDRMLRQGVWNKDGGRTLGGRTVAVVGCGAVGSQVARLLRAFGSKIILVDVVCKTELAATLDAREASLSEALQNADVVTLHVPLDPSTEHMMNTATLSQMRQGSILVNTSRGSVVSLDALKASLTSGHLAGAALDVFEAEPLADPSLAALPTIVCTPHTAGNAAEAVLAMGLAATGRLQYHLHSVLNTAGAESTCGSVP